MEENKNTVSTQEETTEKTFTQAEVDDIVKNRLARERKVKTDGGDFSEREKALNDREIRLMAREKLFDKRLPADLIDVMKFSDEKTLDEAIEKIEKIIGKAPGKAEEQGDPMIRKSWGTSVSKGKAAKGGDPYRKAMGL